MMHSQTHSEKHQRFDQITYAAYRAIDHQDESTAGREALDLEDPLPSAKRYHNIANFIF
jgi:hypothetical protein